MGLTVLIWSLYPLAATIGLETMGSLELLMTVLVVASISALILSYCYLYKKRSLNNAIEIHKSLTPHAYSMILLSGFAGVLSHVFFYIALNLSHKGGVSLIYDAWPIIAVIAAPFLMKRQWKEVSLKEFLVTFIALIGVGFIIFADENISFNLPVTEFSKSVNYTALGGYILAFAGGYMVAMVGISQGVIAEYFKDLNDDFGATLIAQAWGRTLSVIIGTILYTTMAEPHSGLDIHWGAVIFIGLGVFIFGGTLFTYTLLKASSPTISIAYYFVPVLAVIWLWVTGQTNVNAGLFIGGALIVGANIYLYFAGRKAKLSKPL